jgi:ubiquitin-protein ligase
MVSGFTNSNFVIEYSGGKYLKSHYYAIKCNIIKLKGLLSAPNPDDPLDNNVANHWKTDEANAMLTATEWTREFAI